MHLLTIAFLRAKTAIKFMQPLGDIIQQSLVATQQMGRLRLEQSGVIGYIPVLCVRND